MRMPPLPADFSHTRVCKPFCEKSLTLPFVYRNRFGFLFVRVYTPDGVFRALTPKYPRPGSREASVGAGAFVLYDEGQASAGEGCGV